MDKPLVSVCCITYNHEKFINNAIEGFLIQKTNFPLEVIIGEDCSIDATRTIVKSYVEKFPDLLRIHEPEHNIGATQNFITTLWACRGKYIALCEGDDFWTDHLKLQKQVDFLEANPECSICAHKALYHYEGDPSKNHVHPDIHGNRILRNPEKFGKFIYPTCSILFRRQHIDELVDYLQKFKVGDVPLFYFNTKLGDFAFLDEVMATYRLHQNSMWIPLDQIKKYMVLFETYVKVKSELRIQGVNGVGEQIINYAMRILRFLYKKDDFQGMRRIIIKSVPAINSANKKQKRNLLKYSIIAFFPMISLLYKKARSTEEN